MTSPEFAYLSMVVTAVVALVITMAAVAWYSR